MRKPYQICLPILLVCLIPAVASGQAPGSQGGGSFRVQCPTATLLHPGGTGTGNSTPASAEAAYSGPITRTAATDPSGHYTYNPPLTFTDNGGAIKCQQVSGGDGMMTEADGNQTYMFSFGPLSGLQAIQNGQAGTQLPAVFNKSYCDPANANSFYDGVPDASLAINIGGSFTYYYLAPDAGTYFWHCHITPPEHLQMGMVGQLYVRPR